MSVFAHLLSGGRSVLNSIEFFKVVTEGFLPRVISKWLFTLKLDLLLLFLAFLFQSDRKCIFFNGRRLIT